jgi:hypothetical protein
VKVLLVSKNETHAFLLNELEKEGQETLLLSREDTGAWEGIVKRAANPREALEWGPDLTIFDGPGFAPLADKFKDAGVKTLCGGKFHDRLCSDFMFGMDLMHVNKVITPNITKFDNIPDAIEHLTGRDQPWLYRNRSGKQHGAACSMDMQIFLESRADDDEPFYLQRAYSPMLDRSCLSRPEFWVAGLFNGKGLMTPSLYFQKSHNLLPEGLGVPTCEGVSMRTVPSSSKLIQKTLGGLELSLKAMGYTGWVFLGCIVDYAPEGRCSPEDDYGPMGMQPVVIDCSAQPPPGFWAAFLRGLKMPFHLFLDRAANPRSRNTPFEFWDRWLVSRKITVPPYPFTEADWLGLPERLAIHGMLPDWVGIPKEEWGVYWSDVAQASDKRYTLVGPVVGYGVGRGCTPDEALRELRNTVHNLDSLPCKQAKLEPDPVCEFDLPLLESWGLIPVPGGEDGRP